MGYYLIDRGLPELETTSQARLPILGRGTAARGKPLALAVVSGHDYVALVLLAGGLLAEARADSAAGWVLALLGIFALLLLLITLTLSNPLRL